MAKPSSWIKFVRYVQCQLTQALAKENLLIEYLVVKLWLEGLTVEVGASNVHKIYYRKHCVLTKINGSTRIHFYNVIAIQENTAARK